MLCHLQNIRIISVVKEVFRFNNKTIDSTKIINSLLPKQALLVCYLQLCCKPFDMLCNAVGSIEVTSDATTVTVFYSASLPIALYSLPSGDTIELLQMTSSPLSPLPYLWLWF